MNRNKIVVLAISTIFILACHTAKKASVSSSETSSTPPVINEQQNTSIPFVLIEADYTEPGNEELAAIQKQYGDVTLEQLKEGHEIYTKGACINCHGPQNIYQYGLEKWETIIEDMAQRSSLTNEQKNAVHRYVLSIKAKQL